jgi:hypothetical protein
LGSIVLSGIPVNFSLDVRYQSSLWLAAGAEGASLLRWGMILDMFPYYLPLLPVAFLLWCWLKSRNPDWVLFYTSCGLGYILIGATGAAILAPVHPPLINAYTQASVRKK